MMAINPIISFVKNYQYKAAYATDNEAIKWKKRFDLIFDGHLYQRKRENRPKHAPHSLNFRCAQHGTTKMGCAGSVTINIEDNRVNHFVDHFTDTAGLPIHPKMSEVALEVREVVAKMKQRCRTEDKTASKIYLEEQSRMSASSTSSNEELSNHMHAAFRNLRPSMVAHQGKRGGSVRRRMAKSLEEVKIEGDSLLSIKKERWVVNVKSRR
jgi:hypothetical protein